MIRELLTSNRATLLSNAQRVILKPISAIVNLLYSLFTKKGFSYPIKTLELKPGKPFLPYDVMPIPGSGTDEDKCQGAFCRICSTQADPARFGPAWVD